MSKHKDDYGAPLQKGDIVYFGRGHWQNAMFAVIRADIDKSFHVVRPYAHNGTDHAELSHVHFGARSVLKFKPEWVASMDNQTISRLLLNERAKVLDGVYDAKPKKAKKSE